MSTAIPQAAEPAQEIDQTEDHNQDEVWDGVHVVSPSANNEHQGLVMDLGVIFHSVLHWSRVGLVRPAVNVSDREHQWEHNYRVPDLVVYLNGTTARDLDTHWMGGPDFAVEIVSRGDRSREKFDFYAKVGTRELLIIDRYPWILELYRLTEGVMQLVGKSSLDRPDVLVSEVLPLSFRLVEGEPRPRIEVVHSDGLQRWSA